MSLASELQQAINHEYNKLMESAKPTHLAEDKYRLREVESLLSLPYYPPTGLFVQKNWEEGIEELHNAIKRVRRELRWVYLADKQLWVNISVSSHAMHVKADPDLKASLNQYSSDTLQAVHLHPPLYSLGKKKDSEPAILEVTKNMRRNEKIILLGHDALPSYHGNQDLHIAWNSYVCWQETHGIDMQVKDHIISYYGRTSYELTEAGKQAETILLPKGTVNFDLTKDISETPRQILQGLGILRNCALAQDQLRPLFTFVFEQMRDVPWRPTGKTYSVNPLT